MLWPLLGILVAAAIFGPTLWVRWVMNHYGGDDPTIAGTGGELAEHLAKRFDIEVSIEETALGDHYDPGERVVRLTASNFHGRSLTAIAVATHEMGHAVQHHLNDKRLAARTRLAPVVVTVARVSSGLMSAAPVFGLLLQHPVPFTLLAAVGLSGLIARALLHAVTLPTEWDASFGKALPILIKGRYIKPEDEAAVRRVLRAAALTYVAAALADVLNLFRWAAMLRRR
jgi:Zn-dependent membrane protease YugP